MTPWTIQSMEFSRPEYWSGEPFPSPGDLPNSGIKPRSPALQEDSLPAEPQGKLIIDKIILKIHMEIKESRMVMILLIFFFFERPVYNTGASQVAQW